MIEVIKGENQENFINRCVPMTIKDGTTDTNEQAYSYCVNKYNEFNKIEEKEIPLFKLLLTKPSIDTISLVDSPAINENFMVFHKEKSVKPVEIKEFFAKIDTEKRIITGAAMIPDIFIYRNIKDIGDSYVYFDKETIETTSQNFLITDKNKEININHSFFKKGLSLIESWIIADTKKDKAFSFGLEYPVGTWMVSVKVNDDETWEAIKNKDLNGFSIQGDLLPMFITTNKFSKDEDEILFEKIVEILQEIKK